MKQNSFNMIIKHLLFVMFSTCILIYTSSAQTIAFPSAVGYGKNVTGGRGGTVYHVTNLNDAGAGSFRDAVSASNRIIVFDVSGYITLKTAVSCKSNLTIAGQTAPGEGIGLKGGEISFAKSSNIICRYIRIRPGSETASSTDDALSLYLAHDVIMDHCSFSFAPWNNIDGVGDATYTVTNITFQNCLISNPTGQQFGAHCESVKGNWTFAYNIFANSHNRNPLSKINNTFVNNVLYNCSAGYTTHTSTNFKHDIIGNYFIKGPASTGTDNQWYQVDKNQSIYYTGNLKDSNLDGILNGSSTTPYWYQGAGTILTAPWSTVTNGITAYSAPTAYRYAASVAGSFPHDELDRLTMSQIRTLGKGTTGTGAGTVGPSGGLYTSQVQTGLGNNGYGTIITGTKSTDTDSDGMPDFWEKTFGSNPATSDAMVIATDGYTRIEKYINWLADVHAQTLQNTAVDLNLSTYAGGFENVAPIFTVSNAVNGTVSLLSDGKTAQFIPTTNFSGMAVYTFTIKGTDGTAYTFTVEVCVVPSGTSCVAPIATISATGATTFCEGNTVILKTNTSSGLTYQWKNGLNNISGATTGSYSATASGSYSVVLTNASNCSTTSSAIAVIVNALPTATITSPATSICTGSSVILTASTGAFYKWFNGTTQVGTAATYTATTAGAYTVEVTNAGGCKATSAVTTITSSALPIATITTPSPSICNGGSALLTASTGASYKWFNGTTQVGTATTYTAITAGTYTLEVTNAGGCKATSAITTITSSALPIATITTPGTSICTGSSVILTASTGSSYRWFNGTTQVGTNATYTATTAGTYTVEVTNAGGCKATSAVTTITSSALPIATITTSSTSICAGSSVILTASAGASYKWFNGTTQVGTAATYTATTAGAHIVEVTNAIGCKATSAVTTITSSALPIATITTPSTSICTGSSVILTASTGASYKWFNGTTQVGAAATYTATTAGAYTVEITNSSSCKATSAVTSITSSALAIATITSSAKSICAGSSIILTASTGASYKWFNGTTQVGTAATYTATTAGAYTVEVTNTGGCKATSAATTITSSDSPIATITAPSTSFCNGNSVILTASAGSSYKWYNSGTIVGTNQIHSASTPGNYVVEITNASGCKSISAVTQITVTNSITWYADIDNDGKGDPFNKLDACTQPAGYVSIAGDACPTDPNKIDPGNCGCGKTETSCLDCAGTPNGTAVFDNCKICVGGTTGNTACLSTATINGTTANITVIPQPFDANTRISIMNLGMIQSYTIISASGALVETRQGLNTEEIILGDYLASGLYTVIITTEKGIYTTKIVKK
jgi:hypothetical protein